MSEIDQLERALAGVWLTQPLSVGAVGRLAGMARRRHAAPGEVLMTEGQPNDRMSIVIEGRIALRMRVPERGPVTIVTVEPGDLVGWSALVPPYRATSTAVVLTDAELAEFDGSSLRSALSEGPLAVELYPVVLRAVARRLEGTRLQLLDLFSQRWVEPW